MAIRRSRVCSAVAITGVLAAATACGGGDGDDAASAGGPTSTAVPSASASAAVTTPGAGQAAVPADCADERLTRPLAPLIEGKSRTPTTPKDNQLFCSWGSAVPLVTMTIQSASTTADDTGFQTVNIPELARIGAQARAKTTVISVGSKKLFISTFIVNSDSLRISVGYTGEDRRDQQVGDAAVAIARRLHA